MTRFIDLSHVFEDGMPGFKLKSPDGEVIQYSAKVRPFFTHEQSRPRYNHQAEFAITEITFQTSVGTYIDAPFHRYLNGHDISQIALEDVILEGMVIDVRELQAWQSVGAEVLPNANLRGKAVLFNFGWDAHWGIDTYQAYPFISMELIQNLIEQGVKLVGFDTVNADDSRDMSRPAHTLLLSENIYIVENLMNLHLLHGKAFRLFAVPIKAKGAAAMTIRAFAEIQE